MIVFLGAAVLMSGIYVNNRGRNCVLFLISSRKQPAYSTRTVGPMDPDRSVQDLSHRGHMVPMLSLEMRLWQSYILDREMAFHSDSAHRV